MEGTTPLQQVIVFDSTVMVIQAAFLTLVGSFTLEHRHRQSFLLRRKDQLESLALRRMSDELQRLALTDALTGINNRRQFVLDMDAAWEQAVETQTPLALLIIDIDCFKAYNDSQGHAQGDLCLRQVAQAIARQARQNHGLPARLGGEEFAVILSGEAALQALSHAQDLCAAAEALQIPHPKSTVRPVVTASIGVALVMPHQSQRQDTELMAWADEALYEAKTQGRNRAVQFKAARPLADLSTPSRPPNRAMLDTDINPQ
jgi:diguanylate cyclase (GGDEF)-like protein